MGVGAGRNHRVKVQPAPTLLEHLGETEAAKRDMQAIESVTADKSLHTRDLGGKATTAQVTSAVCGQVTAASR